MLRAALIALLCLISLSMPPSRAGWGGGSCGPVGPSLLQVPSLPAAWYRWQPVDTDEYALLYNGHQIGSYRATGGLYRPLEHGEWGPPCDPPISPPVAPRPRREPQEPIPMGGVVTDKIKPGQTILNGKEVPHERARQALDAAASVPDDAHQLAVTVIGPEDKVQAVLKDFEASPALASYKGKVRLQGYPPDSPLIQCGFVTTGSPTIYIQDASGKVLHRQDDYEGGAQQLAEALRKADPNYQPKNDPNLNKQIPGTELLSKVPTPLWALGALVVFLFITKKE